MGKLEYLEALKRALGGLAPLTIAKTLAYYEQRFVDGIAAGQSEADIAAGLDDPKKIAMTLRASVHLHAFEQKRNPANLLRMLVSGVGLLIFNLFMVVPAMVYAALLLCVYVAGLTLYVAGIAITASGLSGANELVLDGPLQQLATRDWSGETDRPMQTKVSIGASGIQVYQEPRAGAERYERANNKKDKQKDKQRYVTVEASASTDDGEQGDGKVNVNVGIHVDPKRDDKAGDNGKAGQTGDEAGNDAGHRADAEQDQSQDRDADDDGDADAARPRRASEVLKRAEVLAGGVHITTDTDQDSRTAQSVIGLALVVGGILLFLVAVVISRYTMIGVRRYAQMNLSLLKGH